MLQKIPKNVLTLGIVSFFNDLASEMIYPIVPLFLTSVLGVPVSVVGLIEGIAEGTASIAKFVFGYISDRVGKRKVFVVGGYSFAAISKLLIALASSWYFVLFARFIDRLGKGLRTSARDSLLLQSASKENKGFIFGFHRSMDSLGAVLGPVAGLVLLSLLKENIRLTFLFAFVPAVVSVFLLVIFVTEKKSQSLHPHPSLLPKREKESLLLPRPSRERVGVRVRNSVQQLVIRIKAMKPQFLFFFAVSILFSLGNSSDAFLILRANNLGFTTTLTVLTYVLYNISQTIFSTPAGQLSDKIGAKRVFSCGLLIFAFVYFLFGIINNPVWIWIIFPIYGVYIAFTDGVSKAYISEFITEKESGTYFGLYQAGTAIAAFLASFIGGLLWIAFHPSATFFYGSIMALAAFFLLIFGKLVKKV